MLERTMLKPKLNFGLKLRKGLGSSVIDGTIKSKKDYRQLVGTLFRK